MKKEQWEVMGQAGGTGLWTGKCLPGTGEQHVQMHGSQQEPGSSGELQILKDGYSIQLGGGGRGGGGTLTHGFGMSGRKVCRLFIYYFN